MTPALPPAQHQEPCAAASGTGISVWPRAAGHLYDRARFFEASGVPLTMRRFAAVAMLTLQALDSAVEQGVGPMTTGDYQVRVACHLKMCKSVKLITQPK